MTDNDRNARTLIICFVVAIMALVPLRIVELRQTFDDVKVLGEMEEVYDDNVVIEEDEEVEEEIILPSAELE